MKEEITRIMRLVQEGKLSPEDAAELIDAFTASEAHEREEERVEAPVGGHTREASGEESTPPPPPPGAVKDPFRHFVDYMEGVSKEVSQSVNWHEVAEQMRKGARKGVEGIRQGVDQIRQGKVNFGWFSAYEAKEVTLPLADVSGKTVRIQNSCGDVKVAGGFEQGSVSARAHVRGTDAEDAKLKAEAYTVIIEETEHEVLIRQPDVSGLEVDLVVQLSSASTVEVKTDSGDIRVLDTGGGCRVNNSSGDIDIRGLKGAVEVGSQSGDINVADCTTPSLTLETKSGDVNVGNVQGNMNARTASGDLNVKDSAGNTISVESVNGDVNVDLTEPVSGSVNLRTVNGDANLSIPVNSDCRVTLSTLRGDVNCDIDLAEEAKMEQRLTGRLGQGLGTVDVSAVNGDVGLHARGAAD